MLTFAVKKKRSPCIAPKRHSPTVSPMSHSLHLQQAKVRHILRSPTLQAKLTIGAPNDKYEQEADRVAEQVMRMPEPRLQRQVEPEEEEEETLQPKPLVSQITPLVQVQRQEEPEEEEETLQAQSLGEQITPLVQRQLEPEEEGERKEEKEEPKIKNCSKKKEGRILTGKKEAEELAKEAYEELEPRILRYYVSTALHRNFGEVTHEQKSKIIQRFKNIESNLDAKTFECVTDDKCTGHCAYADTPGTRICICPTFGQGGCKDVGTLILHESAHNDGAKLDVNTGGEYPPANAIDNAYSYEYFAEDVKKGPPEAPIRYRVPKETAPLEKLQRQAEEEIPIMKKNLYGETPQISHDLQGRLYCSRGGGSHLPLETRAFMEERFGVNFSPVRIHADSQAAQMARALNAEAFTYGKDIYFGAGRFNLRALAGKRLLAHELTHVVQQQGSHSNFLRPNSVHDHVQLFPSSDQLVWGGFRIKGKLGFIKKVEEDLSSINRTHIGQELLRIMNEHGKSHSLIEIEKSGCGFTPRSIYADTINYNEDRCIIKTKCPQNNYVGYKNWWAVPNYVYLFHEIVHAYQNNIANTYENKDVECMAVGLGHYFEGNEKTKYNENKLRRELGVPPRPCYLLCDEFPPPPSWVGEKPIRRGYKKKEYAFSPVNWSHDKTKRTMVAIPKEGVILEDVAYYLYGDTAAKVELADKNNIMPDDPLVPGRPLKLTGETLTQAAQNHLKGFLDIPVAQVTRIQKPQVQRSLLEKKEEETNRTKKETIPVLPGYSQTGGTCGAASLVTALIIWDREKRSSSSPNSMVVTACDLILTYLEQCKDEIIKGWEKRGDLNLKPIEVYDLVVKRIREIRDLGRKPGSSITERQYQEIAMALYYLYVDESSGLTVNQIEQMQRTLGLYIGQTESGLISYEDIWFNSIIRGLKPGEIAQVSWYVKTGPHTFLIGRLQNGNWFFSDQGTKPAAEFQATELLSLKKEVDTAVQNGYRIFTGQAFMAGVWTGVSLLAGPSGVTEAAAGLVAPNTFLAEVDAGWGTWGERVYSGSFVSRQYKFADAKQAAKGLSQHGALIIEIPAGVYSVYQTNLVSESNAKVNSIDKADSTGGLLMERKFRSAWLRVNSGKTSSLFVV